MIKLQRQRVTGKNLCARIMSLVGCYSFLHFGIKLTCQEGPGDVERHTAKRKYIKLCQRVHDLLSFSEKKTYSVWTNNIAKSQVVWADMQCKASKPPSLKYLEALAIRN